jgi:DNA repair protein RadC
MKLPTLGEFKVLTLRECPPQQKLCETPDRAAEYHRDIIKSDIRFTPEVETFHVLVLSCRRHVLGHYLVSTGTQDTILVHAREVFRAAIIASASAIILLHNHPSGDPTPSEADIKVTRDLVRAGQLLKIEVLDHVIVGEPTIERPKHYVSLRELGYFYN